jgi:hypothetical protein
MGVVLISNCVKEAKVYVILYSVIKADVFYLTLSLLSIRYCIRNMGRDSSVGVATR